jgi:hypothetical protein
MHGLFCALLAISAASPPDLSDKTFVAWVTVDDLSQRGGGVVTAMEGEDFDSIVFGEAVPNRWMAGSDYFRRTQPENEQKGNSAETADGTTQVQIAIVWAGTRVTIYRDGQQYASYQIQSPRNFSRDSAVLLGLRYLGSMGPIGHFRGSIDEARIYSVSLDAKTISALRQNQVSDPPPVGMWTFEDGTARDRMGRYPLGQLCGGARIAEGRLWLNGKDAYMVSETPASESQLVFYAPHDRQTGTMWDTWLYYHNGTYFLFYLARGSSNWDNISMATSPDGVHWKERGVVLRKAEGVTWMGTGSTWRSPAFEKDGRFQLNFSEWRGPRQTIFFAESTDLLNWKRLPAEFEFKQDVRWYKPDGRWDCIYTIPRGDGGLFGYWTADPDGRPGVGFGQSADGIRWEALEPPKFDGAPHGEAGAVERIGSKYYMMLGSGGMITLVADKPEGPFRPAARNRTLLHGGPTYFSRFFPTNPDGLIVNHHAIARNGRVYLGLLKRAVVDDQQTLRLAWWQGNDKLKHVPVAQIHIAEGAAEGLKPALLTEPLPADSGVIVEGRLPIVTGPESARTGLYVETAEGRGIAIGVGPAGVTEFGPMNADGSGFKPEMRVDRQMQFGASARFRLVLKQWLLEFYLDDMHVECFSLPARATGKLGLIGNASRPTDLAAWSCGEAQSNEAIR